MSSAPQIKRLAGPLFARHNNLVMVAGNIVCFCPVTHCTRYIYINNRPKRGYFTVEWHVDTLFEPSDSAYIALGRTFGLLGRSLRYRPKGQTGLFEWDDPTMSGDFVDQVEAEIIPLFNSLDTLEKTIAFLRPHPQNPFADYPPWKTLMHVALGEISAAQVTWRPVMHQYVTGTVLQDARSQRQYDQWCLLTEPLMADDRAALARLLHGWEASNVIGTKLESYWLSTPFPLELGA